MPRSTRKRSEADIYHVIVRGEGRQLLFEDEADRRYFMRLLSEAVRNEAAEVLAWCLMSNHVHLLVHASFDRMPRLMQRLTSGYATYFNKRHDHVGHVFAGRYKSLPIDTDEYLMTLVRYIHFNPVCENLSQTCDYSWSSYNDYFTGAGITSTGFVLDVFGGIGEFAAFHNIDADAVELRAKLENLGRQLSDEEAYDIAEQVLGRRAIANLGSMEKEERDAGIAALRQSGLTIKQIERFTGVGRGIVERVKWR